MFQSHNQYGHLEPRWVANPWQRVLPYGVDHHYLSEIRATASEGLAQQHYLSGGVVSIAAVPSVSVMVMSCIVLDSAYRIKAHEPLAPLWHAVGFPLSQLLYCTVL